MCVFYLFIHVLAFVLVVCCWLVGDLEIRTKLILTLLYLASWGLLLIPSVGGYFVIAAQALLSIVLGWMTFGVEFFGGRRR